MEVFFVDRSPESRARLRSLVEAIDGAHVAGDAAGARAAVGAILAGKPDVVLVDVLLEDGSGFEVLREVGAREPGIALYMLSNYASEPYRRHAARLGALDFFDRTTELGRLREALAARARLTRRPVAPL
ncbi:MAG TPA: response regulator [Burkholderiales bacterium]|nr:response regulator [Burkholderiales bacterium]